MTESTRQLSPVEQRFVLHWGEMGARWGINRTVAQIHALIYLSPNPLNAEEIAATLNVARSNVSNSLKELQGWGIVRLVHLRDDKRDHFTALTDVWEMFRVVLDERKRREVDPTLRLVRECIAEADGDQATGAYARQRLHELAEFFETTTSWYEQIRQWPTAVLTRFLRLGDKLKKWVTPGSE